MKCLLGGLVDWNKKKLLVILEKFFHSTSLALNHRKKSDKNFTTKTVFTQEFEETFMIRNEINILSKE